MSIPYRLPVVDFAQPHRRVPECPGHAASIAQLQEEVRSLAARLDTVEGPARPASSSAGVFVNADMGKAGAQMGEEV